MKMQRLKTVAVLALTLTSMLAAPVSSLAANSAEEKEAKRATTTFDLLVVRPVGFAMMLGGAAVFLATLPVTAIAHENDRAGDILLKEPARIAFGRR